MSDLKVAIPVGNMSVEHYRQALQRQNIEAVEVHDAVDINAGSYDGLLLPGGVDIDPALYHQENTASFNVDHNQDLLQLDWLDAFVKAEKPVLGICRGHQLINIYFGGSLIQDLETKSMHAKKHMEDPDQYHLVEADDSSFLNPIYGSRFLVNSSHHQAVDAVGKDLIPSLYSTDDHVEEASRHAFLPIWSVQWHPERCLASYGVKDLVDGDLLFAFFKQQMLSA